MQVFAQISNNQWIATLKEPSFFLCQIPFNVGETENILGIPFTEYHEDGLGVVYSCFLQLSKDKVWFRGFGNKEQKIENVAVYSSGDITDPKELLQELLRLFSLNKTQLVEVGNF
jgi:hypothetical protein